MARSGFCGYDAKDSGIDFSVGSPAGVSYDTGTVHTAGGASLKVIASSGVSIALSAPVGAAAEFHRVYINFSALPTTNPRIIVGDTGGMAVRIKADGTLQWMSGPTVIGTGASVISTGTWYRLEFRVSSSTSSLVRLKLDGIDQVTTTTASNDYSQIFGPDDTVADTYTIFYDDYSSDTADWVGPGNVVLLLPISDNARATLWTGGTGGTTNLFDAVNNTPPIGTATETNLTQIEHAGGASGSTDDYSANMTSYSTAGIAAGSTINAVRAVAAHGEDIATGTKLLTFSIASNPAQGSFETNFSAGNDVGALGTYPSNWAVKQGTQINTPSVTLGTSPVMTMRRPETASRVASVCFMGIYVDYTPGTGVVPEDLMHQPWFQTILTM